MGYDLVHIDGSPFDIVLVQESLFLLVGIITLPYISRGNVLIDPQTLILGPADTRKAKKNKKDKPFKHEGNDLWSKGILLNGIP